MSSDIEPTPSGTDARRNSVGRTLLVATGVSLVCSVIVSASAVLLEPRQARNAELDRQRNVLEVAGLLTAETSVEDAFRQIEQRVVDLRTGRYADDIDPATFDALDAARDSQEGVDIPPELDLANIGRRARHAVIYRVEEDGELRYLILPVYGQGLWSTLYGFIALEGDLNTIVGLQFYQHAETPGLGGEIDNPGWRALWRGKLVYDENVQPAIRVIRGAVPVEGGRTGATSLDASYEVDGLSGATLTGRSVTALLHYWLGDHGYGPYLQRMWRDSN